MYILIIYHTDTAFINQAIDGYFNKVKQSDFEDLKPLNVVRCCGSEFQMSYYNSLRGWSRCKKCGKHYDITHFILIDKKTRIISLGANCDHCTIGKVKYYVNHDDLSMSSIKIIIQKTNNNSVGKFYMKILNNNKKRKLI